MQDTKRGARPSGLPPRFRAARRPSALHKPETPPGKAAAGRKAWPYKAAATPRVASTARAYDGRVSARWRIVLGFALSSVVFGQTYSPPAGIRPARRGSATSILPGGRILAPAGQQYPTAPGPAGLAVSASGKVLVSVNAGPPAASLTWLESDRNWEGRTFPLREMEGPTGGGAGVVFAKEHMVLISEGRSGRVALFDLESGDRRSAIDLNRNGYHDSFTATWRWTQPAISFMWPIRATLAWWRSTRALGVIDAKPRGLSGFGGIKRGAVRAGAFAGPKEAVCDRARLRIGLRRGRVRAHGPRGGSDGSREDADSRASWPRKGTSTSLMPRTIPSR